MKLCDKKAVITGASQGLGRAIAEAFVREGASVMLCARQEDSLNQAIKELKPLLRSGQQIMSQVVDISKFSETDELFKTTLREFKRIDILVNNAGIYGPKGLLENVSWVEWMETLNINLFGTVYACRTILPHFKKQKKGKIINLSGGGATNPLPYLSAYATSKAAVVRFTETLAEEAKNDGIDVNAIAPGALNTRLLDEILQAGPSKVGSDFFEKAKKQKKDGGSSLGNAAELAVFLASDESSGITGKLISAVWDPWKDFGRYKDKIQSTDVYALRRITPKDRGIDWELKTK